MPLQSVCILLREADLVRSKARQPTSHLEVSPSLDATSCAGRTLHRDTATGQTTWNTKSEQRALAPQEQIRIAGTRLAEAGLGLKGAVSSIPRASADQDFKVVRTIAQERELST